MHTSSLGAQSFPRFLPVPEGSMSRGAWFAMTLLSLCAASVARAQSRVISGRVVNATTRDAVPFATVSVVGGIQAAQGNEQGQFRIVVPPTVLTLSARAIGYKRGEVRVTPQDSTIEIASNQDNGTNRLADLLMNDIASVQVMEGAAASASIYGSRATNGVVMFNSQHGRVGDTQFRVTQRLGTYDAIRLPGERRFLT